MSLAGGNLSVQTVQASRLEADGDHAAQFTPRKCIHRRINCFDKLQLYASYVSLRPHVCVSPSPGGMQPSWETWSNFHQVVPGTGTISSAPPPSFSGGGSSPAKFINTARNTSPHKHFDLCQNYYCYLSKKC